MNALPTWVSYLQALATPAIALAGVVIAASSHWLARQRRKDELFDRRYEFYRQAKQEFSKAFGRPSGESSTHWRDSLAEEASFIFPSDIAEHIRHFRTPIGEEWIIGHIPASFVTPFVKYLRFKP